MGNYPYEVENCVPQLPGHVAIGVIFPNDFGELSDRGKCMCIGRQRVMCGISVQAQLASCASDALVTPVQGS